MIHKLHSSFIHFKNSFKTCLWRMDCVLASIWPNLVSSPCLNIALLCFGEFLVISSNHLYLRGEIDSNRALVQIFQILHSVSERNKVFIF